MNKPWRASYPVLFQSRTAGIFPDFSLYEGEQIFAQSFQLDLVSPRAYF